MEKGHFYETMKTGRYKFIDAVKGIGAILVIIGHLGINYYLTIWIYMFHMPLFFFISGFLEKESSSCLRTDIFHKANKILYPYFSLGICFNVCFSSVFDWICGNKRFEILKKLIALLYGNYINENNYNGTLWFLAALFSTYLLFRTINFLAKKEPFKILYTCMIIICGLIVKNIIGTYNFRLPYCMDIALFAIGFYMGGYFYKSYKEKLNINRIHKVIFLLILGTCIGGGKLFIYVPCRL